MIESVRKIADAVLYEGFLLFPYGKGALKNQMPFQFGVVMPQGYRDETEPSGFESQFVLRRTGEEPVRLQGLLRFLTVDEKTVEREIPFGGDIDAGRIVQRFHCGAVRAVVSLAFENDGAGTRVTLSVRNDSRIEGTADRRGALRKALVSAHAVLEASGGEFASLLDPPETLRAAVCSCRNGRWFPVLAGDGDEDGRAARFLLVSPIVLYDFPKVADASAGPTFDGTEIDELLSLSVAALSDDERAAARDAHPAVAAMVDRAESFTVVPGWRVRVHPKRRADVWDAIVDGRTARVVDVKTDVDGRRYVGVLFEDDPASEMHEWYGRSFFYGVDEIEKLP